LAVAADLEVETFSTRRETATQSSRSTTFDEDLVKLGVAERLLSGTVDDGQVVRGDPVVVPDLTARDQRSVELGRGPPFSGNGIQLEDPVRVLVGALDDVLAVRAHPKIDDVAAGDQRGVQFDGIAALGGHRSGNGKQQAAGQDRGAGGFPVH
jgi:hypothetical protein